MATGTEVTAVLDVLGAIVTGVMSMVTTMLTFILSQPILLIPFGLMLIHAVIRVVRHIL